MKLYILTTLTIITFSCANQTAPTGGPKDEDPPELISSNPGNGDLNVSTKELIIVFNESIKTDNPKEQIIITPRLNQEYTFKAKKDKLFLSLTEPLEDSTTYTLNFREGVKDLTEGNPPNNLKIAFSTGPYLDSLEINGTVKNLLTNKPVADYSVYLYDMNDTITFFNGPPLYLTKTDKTGKFQFENLKVGTYNLYALKDKNKNLMADVKSESYGFYPQTIQLDSSISNISLTVQSLNVNPIEKISDRQNGTGYEIKYNKNLYSYNLQRSDSQSLYSNFTDETNTVIRIYNPHDIIDSLELYATVYDSVKNQKIDTLFLKFEQTVRKPLPFIVSLKVDKVFINTGMVNSTITFNKPISNVNYDSIYIYIDSLHILKPDTISYNWNVLKDNLNLIYQIDSKLLSSDDNTNESVTQPNIPLLDSVTMKRSKPDKKPYLYLGKSAFISVEQDSSKSKELRLTFTTPDLFGIVLVEVQTIEQAYIIQLLDLQNNVIQSKSNNPKFSFINVPPGDYKIRALIDSNNNGLWDPGNIMQNIIPEPVIFFKTTDGSEKITIRANWELGPNIIEF